MKFLFFVNITGNYFVVIMVNQLIVWLRNVKGVEQIGLRKYEGRMFSKIDIGPPNQKDKLVIWKRRKNNDMDNNVRGVRVVARRVRWIHILVDF